MKQVEDTAYVIQSWRIAAIMSPDLYSDESARANAEKMLIGRWHKMIERRGFSLLPKFERPVIVYSSLDLETKSPDIRMSVCQRVMVPMDKAGAGDAEAGLPVDYIIADDAMQVSTNRPNN